MSFTPTRLRVDADLVAHAVIAQCGITPGANTPADVATRIPYIACHRIGGASIDPRRLDRATFVVDCWSGTRPTAVEIAETVASLFFLAQQSQTPFAGATISSFVELTAPFEVRTDGQPSGLYRVTATYSLHVRPAR